MRRGGRDLVWNLWGLRGRDYGGSGYCLRIEVGGGEDMIFWGF